jgi:DNA replication ATP-dependent helicase Dna2
MSKAPQVHRVTPSGIARYFFLDCDRFLRYSAVPSVARLAEGIPDRDFDTSPLMRDVLDSGLQWEEQIVTKLLAGRVSIAPVPGLLHERRFTADETIAQLKAEPAGRYLYQGTLVAPTAFYYQYGLDASVVMFGDTHPDLIEVRESENGIRILRVIDVKRGDSLQVGYRIQVALYAMILDAVLRAAGVKDVRADLGTGAVWLGDHTEPHTFPLSTLHAHLVHFLAHTLPVILASPPHAASWHFNYQCERCGYEDHCRSQMRTENNVSRLTNLTVRGKQHLATLGVHTLSQLRAFLARPDADEALSRCASLAGERHYLDKRLQAFESGAPITHDSAAPLPINENVAVFVTLQREPLGRLTYLAGMLVHCKPEVAAAFSSAVQAQILDGSGKPRPVVKVAEQPEDVVGLRDWFLGFLHAILLDLHKYNAGRDWAQQFSLQVYTHTERDREQLTEWLMSSLQEPDTAGPAMDMLLHFQGPDLLDADEHPSQSVPFPVVILQNALTKLLALPVEVSYTLPETLQSMGSQFTYTRRDYYQYPLGHGIRSEAVHAAWHRREVAQLDRLRIEGHSYLFALRALLWDLRRWAKDHLFAWPDKFTLPARESFANPVLSRLAFFARYESLIQCLELRSRRQEPDAVQDQLGYSVGLVSRADGWFDVVGEPAIDLSDGSTMPSWLLVRDSIEGRRGQLAFRDYAYRNKPYGKVATGVSMVGLQEVAQDDAGRPTWVSFKFGKDAPVRTAGDRFRLQPRFMDFNSDRVIEYLRRIDQAGGGLFLALVMDPQGAARLRPLPLKVEEEAAPGEAALSLTESQLAAYREVRRRRVVAVWGPPGTGKTHCIAAIILGLSRAYQAAGQPFRVLVTAFTHAAIENVLRKLFELRQQMASDIVIAKGKVWNGEQEMVDEVVAEESIPDWLAQHARCVVGATVYACIKAGKNKELPGFDLVVVDEASQVRVAEAAIPASLVGSSGRLVLAGDDLQLPPIVQGVYPETDVGEPILHRSIFEAVRSRVPPGSPVVRMLLENRRMNDVLTSFAAGLLYGPDYKCFDAAVANRRMKFSPKSELSPIVAHCLDPEFPMVVVVLEGVQAAESNPVEAKLTADLIMALREGLEGDTGEPYSTDEEFFARGVFVVSPHRAQNRVIRRELRTRREWSASPFVDTVDKMQGQEAEVVVISYGVADPEYALLEAEFIYSVQRLNVAVTRARSKTVVLLSQPLVAGSPQVLGFDQAARGLAYMQDLRRGVEEQGLAVHFPMSEGVAHVYRAPTAFT